MFTVTNIRFDNALQRARAEAFLLENPEPDVRIRPRKEVDRAVEAGQGLTVSRGDEICAVSLVYKYGGTPLDRVYSEIGTMVVAPAARGHGIQPFLAKLHLVQIYLEELHEHPGDVFAVVSPGSASDHNLATKVGMQDWAVPPALAVMRSDAGVPFSADKRVLVASEQTIRGAFSDLRIWHECAGTFRAPKGEEHLSLQMRWFSASVLDTFG